MSEDYPRMMYGSHGASRTVASAEEEKELGPKWSRSSDDHRKVAATIPEPASSMPLTEAHIPLIADLIAKRLMDAATPKKDT